MKNAVARARPRRQLVSMLSSETVRASFVAISVHKARLQAVLAEEMVGRSVAEKRLQKPAAHKSFARIAVDDEVSLRVPSASKYKKAAKISKSAPVCPAVRAQIGCASRSRDRSCAQASAARPISREMPGHLKPNRSSSKANLKATKQLAPEPEEDVRTVYCLPASLKRRRFSRGQCSGVVKSLRFDPA